MMKILMRFKLGNVIKRLQWILSKDKKKKNNQKEGVTELVI